MPHNPINITCIGYKHPPSHSMRVPHLYPHSMCERGKYIYTAWNVSSAVLLLRQSNSQSHSVKLNFNIEKFAPIYAQKWHHFFPKDNCYVFVEWERENNNGFNISLCILDKVFHYLSLMLNDELYTLYKTVPFTVYWCKISCAEFN